MLRMKAGMSVYDWICLSWDSWSTLIRVHSALCRFLETCSYGRVERGRKMSKHLAATTVTTASSWNWFTGTNSVILFLADLGRSWQYLPCVGVDLSLSFIRVKNLFDGKAGEWNYNRLHFIGIEALFLFLSYRCFGDDQIPLKVSIHNWALQTACATAVCKEGRLPTQHERIDHLNNLARKKQVISVQMYLSSIFLPQTWGEARQILYSMLIQNLIHTGTLFLSTSFIFALASRITGTLVKRMKGLEQWIDSCFDLLTNCLCWSSPGWHEIVLMAVAASLAFGTASVAEEKKAWLASVTGTGSMWLPGSWRITWHTVINHINIWLNIRVTKWFVNDPFVDAPHP